MNRFLKIATLATLALGTIAMTSCKDDTPTEDPKPDNGAYTGTVDVAPGGPMAYTQPNTEVALTVAQDNSVVEIKMKQVKFAAAMPVSLDITLPGVTLTKLDTGGYKISADEIIPIAGGGPNEKYKITELSGTISSGDRALTFSFVCMSLPVTFTGERVSIE